MNRIDELVESIEKEIAERDEFKINDELMRSAALRKTSVTSRYESMTLQYIDMLGEITDMSRAALVEELATTALMDVMDKMDLSEKFFKRLVPGKDYKKGVKENV